MTKRASELQCFFCGRAAPLVRRLIQGPSSCICDGCVRLAADEIAAQDVADGLLSTTAAEALRATQRIECLKLACAAIGPDREPQALISRAEAFMPYVSGAAGDTPFTSVLEDRR